jgi:hypothetical protein
MPVDTSATYMRVVADELDTGPSGPGVREAARVLRAAADEKDRPSEWQHEMLRLLAELGGLVNNAEERAATRLTMPTWDYVTGVIPLELQQLGLAAEEPFWLLRTPHGRTYVFGEKYNDAPTPARAAYVFGTSIWMRARRLLEGHDTVEPVDRDVQTGPKLDVLEGGASQPNQEDQE